MPARHHPGRRWSLWVAAALVVFAGWTIVSLVVRLRSRDAAPARGADMPPGAEEIDLRNVEYRSSEGGEMSFSLTAETMVRRKKRIGPLTLNPVKEVEMSGVRIEVRHRSADHATVGARDIDLPIRSILDRFLSAKAAGLVSRIRIERLDVTILEGETSSTSLRAASVSIGMRSDALVMDDGFSLTPAGGARLSGKRAEWRPDTRRLVVRGAYVLEDSRGRRPGENASFRIGADGSLTQD